MVITKLDSLYKTIYDMAIGEEYIFNPKWSEEETEWLLSEIKFYIQHEMSLHYGFYLELSQTLTKFRKLSFAKGEKREDDI